MDADGDVDADGDADGDADEDGDVDADADEDDESDAEVDASCEPSEFECGDGTCIAGTLVCDSTSECTDGSDETGCF